MKISSIIRRALLLGALLCSSPVWAQFNKCTTKDGKTVYTDEPCPKTMTGPRTRPEAGPEAIPELHPHHQAIAHWCVERWNREAAPAARAESIAKFFRDLEAQDEAAKQRYDKATRGMTQNEVLNAVAGENVRAFNSDCLQFGFRTVGPSTDLYNARMSTLLKETLERRYPQSRKSYEQSFGGR